MAARLPRSDTSRGVVPARVHDIARTYSARYKLAIAWRSATGRCGGSGARR